jgi:hypothetical protein
VAAPAQRADNKATRKGKHRHTSKATVTKKMPYDRKRWQSTQADKSKERTGGGESPAGAMRGSRPYVGTAFDCACLTQQATQRPPAGQSLSEGDHNMHPCIRPPRTYQPSLPLLLPPRGVGGAAAAFQTRHQRILGLAARPAIATAVSISPARRRQEHHRVVVVEAARREHARHGVVLHCFGDAVVRVFVTL